MLWHWNRLPRQVVEGAPAQAGGLELADLQGTFQSKPICDSVTAEAETSRQGQEFLNSTLTKLLYHEILLIYFLPSQLYNFKFPGLQEKTQA